MTPDTPMVVPRTTHRRRTVDRLVHLFVAIGGLGVVAAVALLFVFLVSVALPLLGDASHELRDADVPSAPGIGWLQYHANTDQFAFGTTRSIQLASAQSLQPTQSIGWPFPDDADWIQSPDSLQQLAVRRGTDLFIGEFHWPTGHSEPARIEWGITLDLTADRDPLLVRQTESGLLLVEASNDQVVVRTQSEQFHPRRIGSSSGNAAGAVLSQQGDLLFLAWQDGRIQVFDPRKEILSPPELETAVNAPIQTIAALPGGRSLMVASGNQVTQWFVARVGKTNGLVKARTFDLPDRVVAIATDTTRRIVLITTANGSAHLLHSTAGRQIAEWTSSRASRGALTSLAITRDDDRLIAMATTSAGDPTTSAELWTIHPGFPEINANTLWGTVWYEGYPQPVRSWQSSAANPDFEPKYSLAPLTFGTLKVALAALLFALPLAVLAAIHTGYFMSTKRRAWIKPGIELLEAVPTVILGFLAGLWLAPLVENHLAEAMSILVVLPAGIVVLSLLLHLLRADERSGELWTLALVPLLVLLAVQLAAPLELAVASGDLRNWLRAEFGITYAQRNALVVGAAMAVAIMPSVYAIAEEAIHTVPRGLINGSLALGATHWQTLVKVVLRAASPAIFAGVVIGLARALGETMIVLMATGNTPLMDPSLFEGLRSLAANIAIELPESEVGGTHYRVLFLSALILLTATLILNSMAEGVRSHLRARYQRL